MDKENIFPKETLEKKNADPKKKLSLSLKAKRFAPVDSKEVEQYSRIKVPRRTEQSNNWAIKNFREWQKDYNDRNPHGNIRDDVLEAPDFQELDEVLSTFVVETRKESGEKYPPRTIYQLLSGLYCYVSIVNPDEDVPQFCSNKSIFRRLNRTLDNLFKELRKEGIGEDSKHRDPLSKQEINRLWETGVLGISTPNQLLNTVFFTAGLYCCLRGGEEHRSLRFSHFKRTSNPDVWTYTEQASKNRPGGLAHLKTEHKTVPIYAIPSAGEHCPIFILDLYLSKVPEEAITKDSAFYLRPVEKPNEGVQPWFTNQVVGKNKLNGMVKMMCEAAGLSPKTNHSLRATSATEMFQAGVPEKVIQKISGHRSTDALRLYQRISDEQHKATTAVLSSADKVDYSSLLPEIKLQSLQNVPNYHEMPQTSATTAPNQGFNFHGCTVSLNVSMQPHQATFGAEGSSLWDQF